MQLFPEGIMRQAQMNWCSCLLPESREHVCKSEQKQRWAVVCSDRGFLEVNIELMSVQLLPSFPRQTLSTR